MRNETFDVNIKITPPSKLSKPRRNWRNWQFDLMSLMLFFVAVATWLSYLHLRHDNSLERLIVDEMERKHLSLQEKRESQILRLEKTDRAAVTSPVGALGSLAEGPPEMWEVILPSEKSVAAGGAAYSLCLTANQSMEGAWNSKVTPGTKQFPLQPGKHQIQMLEKFTRNEFTVIVLLDGRPVIEASVPREVVHSLSSGQAGGYRNYHQCYQPYDLTDPIGLCGYKKYAYIEAQRKNIFSVTLWLEPKIGSMHELPKNKIGPLGAKHVNSTTWARVKSSGKFKASPLTQSEVRQFRELTQEHPFSSYFNTLATAEYRMGNHDKAIDAALKSIQLRAEEKETETEAKERVVPHPADLAILAMSHFKLGDKEQAINYQQRLNEAMTLEAFKDDQECQSFAQEVKGLIRTEASPKPLPQDLEQPGY